MRPFLLSLHVKSLSFLLLVLFLTIFSEHALALSNVTQAITGQNNNQRLALKNDGTLWSVGTGYHGDGTAAQKLNWTQVLSGVKSIASVNGFNYALKTDGSLWSTGTYSWYVTVSSISWTQVATGVSNLSDRAAIKSDGSVWAFNYGGGITQNASITGAVSASDYYDPYLNGSGGVAVKADGSVWMRTGNVWVQDTGITGAVKTLLLAYYNYSVTKYEYGYFILKSDGTLWGKGYSGVGIFGNGSTYATLSAWTQVDSGVTDISSGSPALNVAYVRHTDNSVWVSGSNSSAYQFGDGTTTDSSSWKKVFNGATYASFGILVSTDGNVWVAGAATVGNLGLGATVGPQSKWSLKLETFTVSKDISTSGIDLAWSTTPEVTNYEVWRGLGAEGTKVKIATTTSSSYTDNTAVAGKIYSYQILGVEANAFTTSELGLKQYVSTPLTGTGPWSKVAQGSNYTLALKTNGTLWAAGQNGSGQFGNGTTQINEVYKQVLSGVREVIASGTTLSFAIKTDDTLWAAGGSFGSTWTQIATNVKSVQDSFQYPTIIKNDGSLHFINGTSINLVTGISGVKYATQGVMKSYAIKADDTLWQANSINGTWSQIRTGIKAIIPQYFESCYYSCYYSEVLTLLTTSGDVLTNDGSKDTLTLTGVSAIYGTAAAVAGGARGTTYALRNNGTLWFVGRNTGEAGDGSTTTVGSWTQVLDNVASIPSSSLYYYIGGGAVVRTNGTLWLTGNNSSSSAYMLGLGDTTNRNVWTQYVVGELTATKGTVSGSVDLNWTDVTGGTGTYQIFRSLGLNGTKAKIATTTSTTYSDTTASQGVTTGAVYGYYVKRNDSTQRTNIDYGYRTPATAAITGSGNYIKVDAASHHSLALKSDGRLFASGYNNQGQLGDGTITNSKIFKQVLTGVQDILAGSNVSFALKTDGTLWVAGSGYSSTWTQILSGVSSVHANFTKSTYWAIKAGTAYTGTSLSNWAATSYTGIKQITSVSGLTVYTLKTDGTLYADTTSIGIGIKKIQSVSSYGCPYYCVTYTSVFAIKTDNSLWVHGGGGYLTDGLGPDPLTGWRQVLDNVQDISALSTGTANDTIVLATKTDGTVWATGNKPSTGQYGDGATTVTDYWKQVFDNNASTSIGLNHSIALRTNGTVWVTGYNTYGSHGLNDTTNRTTWTQTGFILPAKVTGVSATDGTQYSKVTIGWTADPDATLYDVFRSTSAGTKGTAIASNLTATSYEDTTVSGSTHYFYTVVAKNPVGSGPDSDQNEGYGKVPAAVASLTATKGTVTDKIKLAWTENPDATSYEVWRSATSGGTATKIATLSVPVSSMDDVSVSGVSSYFYTIKTIAGTLTGAASSEAEGWANGAPTSASASLTASSTTPSAATGVTVVDPNVTAGKTEAYTFAITTPPTAGTLSIVGNKFVYTPPADGLYSGPLTFDFTATDKGGSVITGAGSISVTCGSPTISAFTLPLTSVTQATPFQSSGTFSLPACSTNGRIKVDVLDSSSVVVFTGTYEPTPNGSGLTHDFTSNGLVAAGIYTVRMTADSDSGIATKTAALTVKAVNLPTLNIAPGLSVTVGEETLTATLSNPGTVNCPFTTDATVAQADASKCYVVFTTPPDGMTIDSSGTLPSMSGILASAGSFPITAEVHKFDGTALVKIGQVSKTVTSSCVAPAVSTLDIPLLLPYEIPNYAATYKAYSCNGALSGTLIITKGGTLVETLNLSALDYGAAANLTKTGAGLPAGNYIALLNITGSSGTGSKSQSFSVKAAPMPALTVSPTTASQGETRVDAVLIPSADGSCPLTTDITLAQADTKRCYVELTTTVPDLTAGTDAAGLPILSGYPASTGDYTVQAVVSRWVGSIRYDTDPLIRTVKVTPVVAPTFAFTGKNSVYAGIEKVNLIFKQNSGTLCNLYPDKSTAQVEAVKGKRACFVDFTGDTDLSKALSLNQFKFEGSLTTVGTQPLGYGVKRVFADGMTADIQAGELPITVNLLPPPQVTLKGGYKITDGHYYVPVGQAITRATITAGVPTNAKMRISVTDTKQAFERGGVMSGGAYWISTPALGLLEERPVTLRVAWQDFPSVYNEQVITAVGGTDNNMKLVLEAPLKVADTENITVKVKVGKYTKTGVSYAPESMGQWRTQILGQTNTQSVKTPITEMQDMVDGEATFLINPAGNLFIKLTAVSELITDVENLDTTLASSTRFVEVVKGSPIEGSITAKTLDAPAPKTFTLNLTMTTDNRVALKEVSWQESTDGGDTWITIAKSNTIRHNIGMQEPGKRQVRARMVNKNTLAESYTAPVEVWAYSTLDAQITGPRHMAPGYSATFTGELYREGVLTTSTVNQWKIEAPSGITTATGATATITEAHEGKVYVTLKSRPADTRADDPNAWSIARYYLNVKIPTRPSISGKGPRDVETGKTYHYEGAVRPSWGAIPSVHALLSEWQLPDGSTVAGNSFDWVPVAQDLVDKTPLIFRAWVEGFKDTTTSEMAISYAPWEYVWPNFTMSMKQLTVQAPSDVLLMVNHDQPAMNRRFEGLTYTWSFPSNVTGRQNDAFPNRAAAQILFAGEYDVTVTIRDTRGHETVLTQHIVAEAAVPYNVTLRVGKSNIFNRVPMTVTVRPTIYGGHPLDSVIAQSWKVDGMPVDDFANRSYMVSNITDTGSHVISYTLNSKMGETTTVESPINLINNQLPVCELTAKPNAYVVYAEAKCTDPDGKVIGYAWQINGESIGSNSYRISFNKSPTPQSAAVTITAMDDAKEYSVPVSITVSY